MGSREGKKHVSAGMRAMGEANTASMPMVKEAIKLAPTMCMPAADISTMRAEWPTAAITAQYTKARRGGRLTAANPIAAIAANNASCKISLIISIVIM